MENLAPKGFVHQKIGVIIVNTLNDQVIPKNIDHVYFHVHVVGVTLPPKQLKYRFGPFIL